MNDTNPSRKRGMSRFQWQYCAAMASVTLIDIGMNSVYFLLSGQLSRLVVVIPESVVILGVVSALLAVRLYAPVETFIKTGRGGDLARRSLAGLPVRSAVWIASLTILYCISLFLSGVFVPDTSALEQIPLWKLALGMVWFSLVYAVYYSFYAYFVVENTVMNQRASLAREFDLQIEPRATKLRTKLVYTFTVLALVPMSHLLMDLLLFRDIRLAQGFDVTSTVLLDLFATFVVLGFAVLLVLRSIVKPVQALTETVNDIDRGVLDQRAVITSDDEIGTLVSAVNKMMDTLKERAFIRATFGQYLPEAVAEDIIAGKAPIEPKIETATILFADIEGFTSLAETLSPAELVEVLNDYFSAVIKPVQDNHGVVNQFQGDGMLVTFNVPVRDSQHADNALKTALQMLEVADRQTFGGRRLSMRIGINTGLVFAGNVGSGDRFNYTVHGDAVNVASRLEVLNKELGTRVLVSTSTVKELEGTYPLSGQKLVSLKGKDSPVGVYSVSRDQDFGAFETDEPGEAAPAER